VNVGDKVRHPDFGTGEIVAVTAGEFGVAWQRREGAIGYVPRDSLSLIGRTHAEADVLPLKPLTRDLTHKDADPFLRRTPETVNEKLDRLLDRADDLLTLVADIARKLDA
jgi:hypothetical protein